MRITILDSKLSFNKQQLEQLKALGEITLITKPNLTKQEAIKFCQGAQIVALSPFAIKPFDKEIIDQTPKLRGIAVITTGWDFVDVGYARKKGIAVSNVPYYSSQSVAEHTLGLMLTLIRKISASDKSARQGNSDFRPFLGRELKGKTMGIIGFGSIGKIVAELAKGFEMNVSAYNPSPKIHPGVDFVQFEELLASADIVSLHCPLNEKTKNLISEKELLLMKDTVILINTAREAIVNKNDLVEALKNKKIGGYGVDLAMMRTDLDKEPLKEFENVVMTPHTGFYTKEAIKRQIEMWIENIELMVRGKPRFVVN
jgi:lactate dehydrogenase-like 2-hydroxyacid dehydrogenase